MNKHIVKAHQARIYHYIDDAFTYFFILFMVFAVMMLGFVLGASGVHITRLMLGGLVTMASGFVLCWWLTPPLSAFMPSEDKE